MGRPLFVLLLIPAGVICAAVVTILVPMLLADQPYYPILELAFSTVLLVGFLLGGLAFVYAGSCAPNKTIMKFSRLGWLIPPDVEAAMIRPALVLFGIFILGFAMLGLNSLWD